MPSNIHETLLCRLRENTRLVKATLEKNDLDVLPDLIGRHEEVMCELTMAGDCRELRLLALFTEIRSEVDILMEEINGRLMAYRDQIEVSGNKKKLTQAYSR